MECSRIAIILKFVKKLRSVGQGHCNGKRRFISAHGLTRRNLAKRPDISLLNHGLLPLYRVLEIKAFHLIICHRNRKKVKHKYLRQMFNREGTAGVRLALYKTYCVYASMFPIVPEWVMPRKVCSILNSCSGTVH